MSANSKIEWTDKTWNPVRGCSMAKGSETGGCLNCYAARMAARNLPELKSPTTGESFARILATGPRWTGKVELIESQLTLPLKWRKPQRIFVNSMSDLFHEALPDEAIDRVFAIMALCPQHTFQILTKRPERMLAYLKGDYADRIEEMLAWDHYGDFAHYLSKLAKWVPDEYDYSTDAPRVANQGYWDWQVGRPLLNVWLGVSVENQQTADARIPLLLQTPAAVRFISYEPALGPVDFTPWLDGHEDHGD